MSSLLFLTIIAFLLCIPQGSSWRRRRARPPPCPERSCEVGHWSSWSTCSKVCGYDGQQSRTRTKTVQEACGGGCYYDFTEHRSCNRYCMNGGTPAHSYCNCREGFTGRCCEDEWSNQKVPQVPPLEEMSIDRLDEELCRFYTELRTTKGEEYSKSSLISMRHAIERHLNNPPYNRSLKLNSDAFTKSNKMLNAKIKDLKQQGKHKVEHKQPILVTDLQKLKESSSLQLTHPLSLVRNVWFHIVLYWCRRGREGQRYLKPSSFIFESDENGQYITMAHDESTKNHPGGISDKPSYEKQAKMYETDSKTDGYKAMKLLLQKLNPKCEALFQLPRRDWRESHMNDECWFENRPLGVNTLGNMMKSISQEAKLSQLYTNHCVRATSITLWTDAGLADRHICHISGHRNTASLKHYNSQPSHQQLQKCSDVLSEALTGNPPQQAEKKLKRDEDHCSLGGGGLFNGCNISSVQISFASHPKST